MAVVWTPESGTFGTGNARDAISKEDLVAGSVEEKKDLLF